MTKLKYILKKLFFPSFIYEFYSSLPSAGYFEKATKSIKSLNGKIVTQNSNFISFYLYASKIFGFPSFGKVLVKIRLLENGEYKFHAQFITYRSIFYFVASMLSILLIVNIVITGEVKKIAVIPAIFIGGHLGMLPAKIQRIKKILLNFDE